MIEHANDINIKTNYIYWMFIFTLKYICKQNTDAAHRQNRLYHIPPPKQRRISIQIHTMQIHTWSKMNKHIPTK